MKKHVSELTPEEFQKVFPITLKDYNPQYQKMYQQQFLIVICVFTDVVQPIEHIRQ